MSPILLLCLSLSKFATAQIPAKWDDNGYDNSIQSTLNQISTVCEMPGFTNLLPLKYRRQLRQIWAGIPLSTRNCARQMSETRSIVDSLPDDLKMKVLDYSSSASEVKQSKGKSSSFLSGLSTFERDEFNKILSNRTLSKTDRISLLRLWAQEYISFAQRQQFEQYIKFLAEKAHSFMEKVANLSPEASDAYKRLEEMRTEKQEIVQRLSESAKQELADLWRPRCPKNSKSGKMGGGSSFLNGHTGIPELDMEEVEIACAYDRRRVIDPTRPRETTGRLESSGSVKIAPEPTIEIIRFRSSTMSPSATDHASAEDLTGSSFPIDESHEQSPDVATESHSPDLMVPSTVSRIPQITPQQISSFFRKMFPTKFQI